MNTTLKQHMNQSQQIATTGKDLNAYLDKYKAQFALALPKHMNPDRMVRLALTAFNDPKAKKLRECTMSSIAASIVVASQLGLEIGVAGQAYLVPYKGTCQLIPGWQGIVDLVGRSGRATVWTGAAFEGDDFDYQLGDRPYVKHRPNGEDNPNKITHVYAVGRVNGSEFPVIEVWPIKRVHAHFKKNNKVGDMHYAHQHWEMYARKLPLLQVCKYMPKSIELTNAIAADNAYTAGNTYTLTDGVIEVDVVDEQSGETHREPAGEDEPGITVQDVHDKLSNATDIDQLDEAWDAKGMIADLSKADEQALSKLYAVRNGELRK